MFPTSGRGVGPGGSFLLTEFCLQSERRSRQERVSTRNVTRSMAAFSSGETPVGLQPRAFIVLAANSAGVSKA